MRNDILVHRWKPRTSTGELYLIHQSQHMRRMLLGALHSRRFLGPPANRLCLFRWCMWLIRRMRSGYCRVGGTTKMPNPAKKYPPRDVGQKLLGITRRSAHLWFLAGIPDSADMDDLGLFCDSDGLSYDRQAGGFAHEIFDTEDFCQAGMSGRDIQKVRTKRNGPLLIGKGAP